MVQKRTRECRGFAYAAHGVLASCGLCRGRHRWKFGPVDDRSSFLRRRCGGGEGLLHPQGVNGRWITGRFPKRSAIKNNVANAGRSAKRRNDEAVDSDATPARMTSLPPRDAVPVVPAAPVLAATTPALSIAQVEPRPLPTDPQAASPAAPLVPLLEDERLSKLREALRARANSLTTGTLTPAQAPRPAPEPQSVSLDFRTGTKTTVFSDGTSIKEPFDVGGLRGLAAAPPKAD